LNGTPLKAEEVPLARAVMFGEICSKEFIVRRTDGDDRRVIANAAPVRDKNGLVSAGIVVFMDITESRHIEAERKKAEEKLIESEEHFRKLFENMLNGYAYCRMIYEDGQLPDFQYINVNTAFKSLTGLKNVEGKKVSEVIPGIQEADKELLVKYGRVALTGKPEIFEIFVESLKMWFSISVYSPKKEYFVTVFDVITERKKAEEALRTSEQLYRAIGESIDYGVWVCAPDGRNIYASESFLKMVGITQEQCSNFGWGDVLHPDDSERTIEAWKECVKTGSDWDIEHRFKGVDGQWHHVLARGVAVRDEMGLITSWAGINLDISELKIAEVALRESEDKFKYIFDHSVIGKSITLPTGEMSVNQAFCDMLGYSHDELIKTKWQDISYHDDIELTQNILKSLLSGEKDSARFLKRYIHKNGTIVWTDVGTVLRRSEKGKPLYFLTAISDITERKRAEDELRLQSEIMSHMAEAVYLVKMHDGIIVFANSKFEELFGYQQGEMIGKHVSIVNAPTDKSPEETSKEIMESLAEKGYWKGEVKNIRKDGTSFWTYASVTIFDHSAFGEVLISVQRDITDRKIAESQIRQLNEELESRVIQRTEQLQAANRELEAFSYSVSHDLRAPLRAIHSFTTILQQDYGKVIDEEGNRICNIIETSSVRMGQLIDDLLAFSKVGRTGLEHVIIDMELLAKSVYSELSTPEEQKRITFTVERLEAASGDSVLMRQVLTNLLSNALKYTSKNETANIKIGSESGDKEIIYYVKDNGVGFDMKYSNKLFGVFQRLHSAKEFDGNGVGLAIVQRIIHRHEGRVWAEGEKGNGATFYFALPLNKIK
jgi:PAS domain S-box-containing protein